MPINNDINHFQTKLHTAIDMTQNLSSYLKNIPSEDEFIYISPERTGRINTKVDYRSDLYSLGVSLFHLFSKRYPFSSKDSMQLIYMHIAVTAPKLDAEAENIPPMLVLLIEKLLDKNPDNRYQSIAGVVYDLELILDNPNQEFLIASKDVLNTLQLSKKIYGRESEMETMQKAIDTQQKNCIIISGRSGVGKSELVASFQEKNKNRNIFFTQAKFEQQKRIQTFNALFEAIRNYIKSILFKSEDEIVLFKTKLLENVGENIQLMKAFIPEISTIVPKEYSVDNLHANEAQNRFNITFVKFMQFLSSFEQKIIFFLDDMQWSDVSTIKMIELVLQEKSINNISIILCYRDNEIKDSDPFKIFLNQVQQQKETLLIALASLQIEDIELMLSDIFVSGDSKRYQFAKLLKQKTDGNPFFIKELIHTLYNQKLLSFEVKTQQWHWDLENVELQEISDNVVDTISKKIESAPKSVKEILTYASLIGNEFTIDDIAMYLQADEAELILTLQANQLLYFVTQKNDTEFKFVHDKIQEAFSHFLSEEEKNRFHLKMGLYLLEQKADVFLITDHLNNASAYILNADNRQQLLEFNKQCAEEAFKSNSYNNAIYYLLQALSLMQKNHWKEDYAQSIELYTMLAELYYLNLEFEQAKAYLKITLEHVKTLKDKIKITQVGIYAFIAQNKMKEALSLGLNILEQFDISMPESDDINKYYSKLFTLYDVNDIDALHDLPAMCDTEKLQIIDILNSIMAPAYLVAPHIYPKICYVAIDQCIRYGNSAGATNVYAVHALLLSAFFNEFEQSKQFSKLSQDLIQTYDAQAYRAKVDMIANACVLHWNGSVQETLEPLYKTIRIGVSIGDFEYACYCGMYYTLYSLLSGKEIAVVKEAFEEQNTLMLSLKQSYQSLYGSVWQEFLHKLSVTQNMPSVLEGKYFSEANSLKPLVETNSFSILYNLYFAKAMLALMYDEIGGAHSFIIQAKAYHIGVASLYQFGEFYFYEALINYRYYMLFDKLDKKFVIQLLEDGISYYHKLSQTAKKNNEHKAVFLKALLLDVHEDASAWKQFNNASKKAQENGFVQIQALSYQYTFFYWEKEGMESFADSSLQKSIQAYNTWGASAVSKHLSKMCLSSDSMQERNRFVDLDHFDLQSIFKASHVLAQELSLDELLKKTMQIILENSASQNIFLFLEADNIFSMVAGYKDGEFIYVLADKELPMSIINYVRRTQEELIYSADMKNDFLQNDTYILSNQPKSLFCLPILYQGVFKGVLYLENKDTFNIYSPEKLKLLQYLSNQAMISIEHAKLFEKVNQANIRLEEKITFRTKELAEQKETFEKLFYESTDPVLLFEENRIIDCNSATVEILGYKSKTDVLNLKVSDISPKYQPDGRESHARSIEIVQECFNAGAQRFEWMHQGADGNDFWVDISLSVIKISGKNFIYSHWKDISEQKSLIHELKHLVSYDTMTNIYNRRKFFELAVKRFKSGQKLYAAMIDIDEFKSINDSFGHAVGDKVIIKVASIIKENIDDEATYARIGGEEYALVSTSENFIQQMEHIKSEIEKAWVRFDDKDVSFTVSCGISLRSSATSTLDMLLKESDNALYDAKGKGKNRVERYNIQSKIRG